MAKDVLSTLTPAQGSRKKRKRIARGQGSGHGGTATRGHKGQLARSGYTYRPWFEGGQMPLVRRVPKRGFVSPFRKVFQTVNVETLQRLSAQGRIQNSVVNPEMLARAGVVKNASGPVKVLGNGALSAKLEVFAHAFSKSSVQKIETAGGKVQVISTTAHE